MNALWWNLDQNTNLLLGLLIMPQGQIGTAIVPNAPLYISCLRLRLQDNAKITFGVCCLSFKIIGLLYFNLDIRISFKKPTRYNQTFKIFK